MNIKKLLTVALAAGVLTFGASAAVTPAPASAHTPEVSATVTRPTTPSTPAVVTEQPTEPVLASTGFDAGTIVPIGALLLLTGAALALGRRFTAKRADRN
ncbi:MAG: hypothetical protein JWM51_2088 [Microbacteriaceae bacterium]|nr:hypothetical protein [Microbacteriaceae bacterium]